MAAEGVLRAKKKRLVGVTSVLALIQNFARSVISESLMHIREYVLVRICISENTHY